jgi:hypothetical protein
MENRTFSNSSMDGFMRVLNYNPLDGGELNRYFLLIIIGSSMEGNLRTA